MPSADVDTDNISPEIGITSTPVIDPATDTVYVVVKSEETIGGTAHYVQRLHAINIANGTDVAVPFLIGDTSGGNTNNTQIYVYGSGDGAVVDPYNGTGNDVVQFNALRENQRSALSLVNNVVYVEWASHGDNGPYHGWVIGWNVSNLASSGMTLAGVFNASPNGGFTGVWESGGGLVFEPDGSAFYFVTGNGPPTHGNPVLNSSGFSRRWLVLRRGGEGRGRPDNDADQPERQRLGLQSGRLLHSLQPGGARQQRSRILARAALCFCPIRPAFPDIRICWSSAERKESSI